ncbi:unnamed protein product [Arctogadus glacialis]
MHVVMDPDHWNIERILEVRATLRTRLPPPGGPFTQTPSEQRRMADRVRTGTRPGQDRIRMDQVRTGSGGPGQSGPGQDRVRKRSGPGLDRV